MSNDGVLELSVVMPVHGPVPSFHVARALQSVYDQTLPPVEVIVVEDGPLSPQQLSLLDRFAAAHDNLRRVRLPRNMGAGPANQAGIVRASSNWVAKMDSDDIALPRRFQEQAAVVLSSHSDVVGCSMFEFIGDETNIVGKRSLPETHPEIARYAKMNNPVNHPTVLYSRDLALSAGGYTHLPFHEDYDLMARMLASGAQFYNIPEPLQLFRAGRSTLSRRRSAGITKAELALQRNLVRYGIVSPPRALFNFVSRSAYRLLPTPLMEIAYQRLFYSRQAT